MSIHSLRFLQLALFGLLTACASQKKNDSLVSRQGQKNQSLLIEIQKQENYRNATFPQEDDFWQEIRQEDRKSEFHADLNDDLKQDALVLLIDRQKSLATVILLLNSENGFEAPTELKSTPLRDQKIDLSIKIKAPGLDGISNHSFFLRKNLSAVSHYKKVAAAEISSSGYYCTQGFYFHRSQLMNIEVCD
ncbi:MAG: hypothetical protein GW917_02655 [Bdellovibrionales bacterium]|nr:hypothetical protein [Bdellovibrionales bacterium]